MNAKCKIALIGLSGLERIGLKYLIHDEHDAKVESYPNFMDYQTVSDERDIYVVSADEFASNVDFFLPRKQKTLLVVRNKESLCVSTGINIISVNSDETEFKMFLSTLLQNAKDQEPQHSNLSAREIEVLRLIASGKINKEIADELYISINTVITHRKNISSKLGIKSTSGLSLYAMMNGII